MNNEKIISYYGQKRAENLSIQSYWKMGKGHVQLFSKTCNILTPFGQREFEDALLKIEAMGGERVCINGADFGINELLFRNN